jgi:hypothetical protein
MNEEPVPIIFTDKSANPSYLEQNRQRNSLITKKKFRKFFFLFPLNIQIN